MFKMLLGAAVVVALVGYGVITPHTLEQAGTRMKTGINQGAAWVKQQTDPSLVDQAQGYLNRD